MLSTLSTFCFYIKCKKIYTKSIHLSYALKLSKNFKFEIIQKILIPQHFKKLLHFQHKPIRIFIFYIEITTIFFTFRNKK